LIQLIPANGFAGNLDGGSEFVKLFHYQINDDTAAATTPFPRRRGTEATRRIVHTLRKPTTTPTKVALDLVMELNKIWLLKIN
jgi:hypothetical protein